MVPVAENVEAVQSAQAPAAGDKAARAEISLRNVGVSYPAGKEGAKTILSGLSLDIAVGEFVVILGETGCGKSTLLRMILGQELPTSGSIVVDGKPVTKIDARCGYVPQKYSLFPDRTALGNVMYGPENAFGGLWKRVLPSYFAFREKLRAQAEEYLTRMGLRAQDLQKYPHQLSGGMQQRVAIAQALLMHPPVLLMDEAFSALDPSTRASLQQQLRDVWLESRPTVVFVTHNTAEALLLGTRLILLGRHSGDTAQKSNLLLDLKIPGYDKPLSERRRDADFQRLLEFVKLKAYNSSSMNQQHFAEAAGPDTAVPIDGPVDEATEEEGSLA